MGGVVLSSFIGLLLVIYLGSRIRLRRGSRIQLAFMSFIFAALPGLGYLLGFSPDLTASHPMLQQPEGSLGLLIYIPLKLLYLLAQLPLQLATICHEDIFNFVYFTGEYPTPVRPWAVGVFWLGMGLTFLAAGMALDVKRFRGEVR
jgi:hypothetical protein